MTDVTLKSQAVELTVSTFDTVARQSFRAFGTLLGTCQAPELGLVEVYAFGNTIEFHAGTKRAELNLGPALAVAVKMMREG